jgi:hypothetical protein
MVLLSVLQGASVLLMVALMYGYVLLHADDLALCFVAAVAGLLWFELYKLAAGRRTEVR